MPPFSQAMHKQTKEAIIKFLRDYYLEYGRHSGWSSFRLSRWSTFRLTNTAVEQLPLKEIANHIKIHFTKVSKVISRRARS
jgi:hypothetical protein